MANVFDVAEYVLQKLGPISAMKLQKLVYYCQAWSLVWDDGPIFPERIEAWVNGPVVPQLYDRHRGKFDVTQIDGNPANLTAKQAATVDAVLGYYGDKSSQWLSDLTHRESPWLQARRGLAPEARGGAEITLDSMAEYYSSLQSGG